MPKEKLHPKVTAELRVTQNGMTAEFIIKNVGDPKPKVPIHLYPTKKGFSNILPNSIFADSEGKLKPQAVLDSNGEAKFSLPLAQIDQETLAIFIPGVFGGEFDLFNLEKYSDSEKSVELHAPKDVTLNIPDRIAALHVPKKYELLGKPNQRYEILFSAFATDRIFVMTDEKGRAEVEISKHLRSGAANLIVTVTEREQIRTQAATPEPALAAK